MHDLVVLGDSLAVSPSRTDNFPLNLQKEIDRRGWPWRVVNASSYGSTTADAVRRIDAAIGARAGLLVIAVGANDGLRGVSLSALESNLRTLIQRGQRAGIDVLLCGMETPPAHGWPYTVSFHNLFPRLAREHR